MSWLIRTPKRRIGVCLLLVGLFFLLIVLFGCAAFIFSRDALDDPDEPAPMTLPAAIEASRANAQWVLLQNTEALQWDCNSIVYRSQSGSGSSSKWTNVVLTDPAQSTVLAVDLSGRFTCDELSARPPELSGELSHLKGEEYEDNNFQGRLDDYPPEATFLSLCTYCEAGRFSWFGTTASMTLMFVALNRALQTAGRLRRKATSSNDKPDTYLMCVFNFTASDLTANMLGTLSSRQREYLSKRLHWLIGFFIFVDVGLGLLVLHTMHLFDDGTIDELTLIAAGVFLAVGPVLAGLDFLSSRRIHKGHVSTISGVVTLQTKTVENGVYHYAKIADKDFFLSPEQYSALVNGRSYCFYYLEGVFNFMRGKRVVLSVQSL
jgi:hypothetical protein